MSTPSSRYFQFGTGYVLFTPGVSAVSNALVPSTPTPQLLATVQDASLEITMKLEELRGNLQMVEVLAAGDIDVKGKVSVGRFNIDLFQQAFPNMGTAISTGIQAVSVKEAHSVPASSTYTVTISPPASGVFVADLGVTYANGSPLLNQGSGSLTAAGQYTVVPSTGVYTFDSADASANVLINYSYSLTTTGRTLTLTNSLQGATNYCSLVLDQPFSGNNAIILNNVVFNTFKLPFKRSGFTIAEIDFTASADANGQLGHWFQGISG